MIFVTFPIKLFEFLSNEIRQSFHTLLSIGYHSLVHLFHQSFFRAFSSASSSSQFKFARITTSIRYRIVWELEIDVLCHLSHKISLSEWYQRLFFLWDYFYLLILLNDNRVILSVAHQITIFFKTTGFISCKVDCTYIMILLFNLWFFKLFTFGFLNFFGQFYWCPTIFSLIFNCQYWNRLRLLGICFFYQ